jgi:FkbM family methyltransferase
VKVREVDVLDIRKTLAPAVDWLSGVRHSFLSYSQFGEDAVLNSLLNRLRAECGFSPDAKTYVDVGANVPVRHSNTYALSQRGWSGLLVEPVPRCPFSFRVNRRRDRLVTACVGEVPGNQDFYTWYPEDVYNTTVEEIAKEVEVKLGRAPVRVEIETVRLDELIGGDPRFEKGLGALFVDVEGAELTVLKSIDLTRWRPALIVIEVLSKDIPSVFTAAPHLHLQENGYRLYAAVTPSLIYLRSDLARDLNRKIGRE